MGFLATICLAIILGVYGYFELVNLVWRDEPRISSHTYINHYSDDKVFDMDKRGNGLDIAFGLTSYDGGYSDDLEDPDYGVIKVFMKSWDPSTNHVKWKELQKRKCRKSELGLGLGGFDNDEAKFYPMQS